MNEIKDYYVLGDLHSSALISKDASIDWLCLPHFDSPSIFAKLLDKNGGSFSIDATGFNISSSYIPNTPIVKFEFKNKNSEFELHDFMVPQTISKCKHHYLVRKFIGKKGVSNITLLLNPKSDYAKTQKKLNFEDNPDLEIIVNKEDNIFIYPPDNAYVIQKNGIYQIQFTISKNQELSFVMEYAVKKEKPLYSNQNLEQETINFWNDWVSKGQYFEFCKDELIRQAITLKLMQYYPTGAIVASPTTSLPEVIGGSRNWDYRYVWIRDATFTLYALYVLGYQEEAIKFFDFLEKVIEQCGKHNLDISLMYTLEGKTVPQEKTLPYLAGYKDSKPIRIGNGATDQFQLDVYGALIDSYYFISKRKVKINKAHRKIILTLVKKIKQNWLDKDYGIWEVRSGQQHFTYSKVMCWVGINRALRMKGLLKLTDQKIKELEVLEKQIKDWIWQNCYDLKKETFNQYPNSNSQDATNLLFVLLQFLDKHNPLTKKIIKNTSSELVYQDIFVYRYLSKDGLAGKEGAFLLCTFWLISAWAIIENVDKASNLFNKFENYIAKSGLLSEEIDPESKEYLGNFPQAFSHIGFIMSAYYLQRYTKKQFSLHIR